MKNWRKIFDDDYYKIQYIISDPKFETKLKKLKDVFVSCGCPIPQAGFKNYKDYLEWNDKYFIKRTELESSQDFQNKINKITKSSSSISYQQMRNIEDLKDRALPPIYGYYLEEILADYNIDRYNPKYKKFKDFLINFVFFNKKEFSNPLFVVKWVRNKKTRQMELFIQILPNTRKSDIANVWSKVKEEQKKLPSYSIKDKQYKTFFRDLEIYNTYKSLQKNLSKSKRSGVLIYLNKRVDHETWRKIKDKHGDLSWENIRKIVQNIEKMKKEWGLL